MQQEATFNNTLQSLWRYVGALEEDYGVPFVYMRISNIVEDMISSKFFAVKSGAIYIRLIRVRKMIVKHKGVMPVL